MAGLVATVVMSVPMLLARRLRLIRSQAPEDITHRALAAWNAEDQIGRRSQDLLTASAHLAFGAASGVVYAVTAPRVARDASPVGSGIAFGLLVWAVSYAGWLPALDLMPPPQEDEPARPPLMIGAHIVFGAVLGRLSAPRR